jgi:Flp pilus assembly protein TadB
VVAVLAGLLDWRIVLAALLAAVVVMRLVAAVVRPPSRLGPRVRPYTVASRAALGQGIDLLALSQPAGPAESILFRLFAPPVTRLAQLLGGIVESHGDERLLLRLRQAGVLRHVPEHRRALQYRVQLFSTAAVSVLVGLVIGFVFTRAAAGVLLFGGVGLVFGLAMPRGRLDRVIARRREEMRVELYTVNHLLAMNIRIGGGVIQALQRVVERGNGHVVGELAEVLRAHRSGVRIGAALTRAAHQTPEPHAARTYKLLATGAEHGADLAKGLMGLSRDLRSQRREDLRRRATRQRGAMIIPIVVILGPVLLFLIAAPIPRMVFGQLSGR